MYNVRVAISHDFVYIQIITKYSLETQSALCCGTKSIKSSVVNLQPSKCSHFYLYAMMLYNSRLNFQSWLATLVMCILIKGH